MKPAEKYIANDLSELKKVALLNKDIDFLRKIVRFEKRKPAPIYYMHETETVIRNWKGEVIDPETLTKDPFDLAFNFIEITVGWYLQKMPVKDTDLYDEVNSDNRRDGIDTFFKFYIRELPKDVSFPLPEGFNWEQACFERSQQSDFRARKDVMGLFVKCEKTYYHYLINGNKVMSNCPPRDGTPYTTSLG